VAQLSNYKEHEDAARKAGVNKNVDAEGTEEGPL